MVCFYIYCNTIQVESFHYLYLNYRESKPYAVDMVMIGSTFLLCFLFYEYISLN